MGYDHSDEIKKKMEKSKWSKIPLTVLRVFHSFYKSVMPKDKKTDEDSDGESTAHK